MLPPSPPKRSRTDDRQHEVSRLPMLAEGITLSEQIDLPGAASTTRRTKVPNICTLRAPDGPRGVMTAHRGWLVAYFIRERQAASVCVRRRGAFLER
jgi:hypothetical protein